MEKICFWQTIDFNKGLLMAMVVGMIKRMNFPIRVEDSVDYTDRDFQITEWDSKNFVVLGRVDLGNGNIRTMTVQLVGHNKSPETCRVNYKIYPWQVDDPSDNRSIGKD